MKRKVKKPMPTINLVGTIDEALFKSFTHQLEVFEAQGITDVNVLLSSAGGNAYDAIAFYDRMRLSPCDITITAYGLVASAAVLVLAGGFHRRMTANSWLMVHEDSTSKLTEKVKSAENHIAHMRRMEDQWNELLADSSGDTESDEWEMHADCETYFSAEECLKTGLIDEVV